MENPVEHGGGEDRLAGEGLVPRAEGQVRGQDHRAALVALGDDLEEQVRLLAPQRQVADLVDDQEPVEVHGPVHRLLDPALALRRLEGENEIGGRREADLPAALGRRVAERDRQMRLADAARAQEHDVLASLHEGEARQFLDLLPRCAGREGEVEAADSDGSRPPIPTRSRPTFRFDVGHSVAGIGYGASPRVSNRGIPVLDHEEDGMPARRELTMRQIKQMLRLAHDGVSAREIGRTLGIARSTVQDNLGRATAAGLTWPLDAEVTDAVLEQRLFARAGVKQGMRRLPEPDWPCVIREMRRSGVNLTVLWEEYRETHPDGYGYSRFCDLYREFERRLTPVMRQHHAAGDKVFVDYSGKKIEIVDPTTGIVREAEIFVAVLGASSLTYAEATWTQTLPDWIGAHVRLFRFLGGVPRLVVPDNLKSAVHKASFYDPEINRSYGMMADHYGVGILPARPRKPRDKAKVEAGVRLAQTYILGRLRRQTFFSLAECNAAIATMVERINAHPMRRLGTTRRALFEAIERAALRPLPAEDYAFSEWRLARVNLDYHVEAAGFLYSVPHALIREQVDLRITARTIEVFHRGQRVAAHERRYAGRRHGTDPEHMPSAHRRYAEWSPERFRRWARGIGPETEGLVVAILHDRPHPEQGFRTCLGILRLYRGLDPGRAEAASARAVAIGALTYKSIASILSLGLDRTAPSAEAAPVLLHPNLRGPRYFH